MLAGTAVREPSPPLCNDGGATPDYTRAGTQCVPHLSQSVPSHLAGLVGPQRWSRELGIIVRVMVLHAHWPLLNLFLTRIKLTVYSYINPCR